jgi:hypothetical protein
LWQSFGEGIAGLFVFFTVHQGRKNGKEQPGCVEKVFHVHVSLILRGEEEMMA